MYLVIAEKPSVSRAIAEVIGAQEREDGYLRGTDCMVSWCFGHLVEYVSPDVYDEKFSQWRYEDLPIIPKDWKVTVSEDKKDQFYSRIRRNGCTRIFIIIRWMCKRCSRELDISSENMILKAFPPINRRWKIRFVQSMNLVFIDRKMM